MTNTLRVESREALQNWMEALWQLFFDMSKRKGWAKPLGRLERAACCLSWECGDQQAAPAAGALSAGQWKHCCDEVMKIEAPAPRKPPQALAKQGSLYHEMGKSGAVSGGADGQWSWGPQGDPGTRNREKAQWGTGPTPPYCLPLFSPILKTTSTQVQNKPPRARFIP